MQHHSHLGFFTVSIWISMSTVACYMVIDMYGLTICQGWREHKIYSEVLQVKAMTLLRILWSIRCCSTLVVYRKQVKRPKGVIIGNNVLIKFWSSRELGLVCTPPTHNAYSNMLHGWQTWWAVIIMQCTKYYKIMRNSAIHYTHLQASPTRG